MESLSTLNPLWMKMKITHNTIEFVQRPTGDGKAGVWIQSHRVQFLWPVLEALDAGPSLLSLGWVGRGRNRPILPAFLPLLLLKSLARGTAQSQWLTGARGQFHSELQAQLLVVRPVLVNCSQRAHPFSWKTKIWVTCSVGVCKSMSETFYLFLQILSKGNVCPALGLYVLYLFDHNHLG